DRARRGLSPLALSARLLRRDHESRQCDSPGPDGARAVDARAARRPGSLDRALSEADVRRPPAAFRKDRGRGRWSDPAEPGARPEAGPGESSVARGRGVAPVEVSAADWFLLSREVLLKDARVFILSVAVVFEQAQEGF